MSFGALSLSTQSRDGSFCDDNVFTIPVQLLNLQQVDLVKVPNKSKDWATSLTPHKACDRFDKEVGKTERNAYQKSYAEPAIERLRGDLPGWNWTWTDIVAMQQLCGEWVRLCYNDIPQTSLPAEPATGTRFNRLRDGHQGFFRVLQSLQSTGVGAVRILAGPVLLLHAGSTEQVDGRVGRRPPFLLYLFIHRCRVLSLPVSMISPLLPTDRVCHGCKLQ